MSRWAVRRDTLKRPAKSAEDGWLPARILPSNHRTRSMVMSSASRHVAQIGRLHPGVVLQFGRVSVQHDPSGLQYIGPVRDGQGHAGVLLHQKDGGASPVDLPDHREYLP